MSDRTTASLLTAHIYMMSTLADLVRYGKYDEAFAFFRAHAPDFSNLAGAMNAALPQAPTRTVLVHPEIPFGDFERRFFDASTSIIHAFPFRIPATGVLHISESENGGQPWSRLLTVSETAGDMSSKIRSEGKVTDVYVNAGVDFPVGALVFANSVLTQEPSVQNASRTGTSIVWPQA